MLAVLARLPADARVFEPPGWLYQRKLDGLRGLAVRNGPVVELYSRNHLPMTGRFPEVMAALAAIGASDFVIDGEVVAFEGDRTSFTTLQRPGSGARPVYVVFDLLHLLGRDVRGVPLADRAGLLGRLLGGVDAGAGSGPGSENGPAGVVRLAPFLEGTAADLLDAACAQGWEGVIAKRAGSTYQGGRSADWRKLKCAASQELVVGGWTDPSGARRGFGALLVGYFDDAGRLRYAGRVGSGFSDRELRDLQARLRELHVDASPFAPPLGSAGGDPAPGEPGAARPGSRTAGRRPAPAGVPRDAHWCRPEIVVAVEFSEWTRDGLMRQPRFQAVRFDKDAREVRREVPPAP
jgi:DNA ligase D-like protein (predicted ligase)